MVRSRLRLALVLSVGVLPLGAARPASPEAADGTPTVLVSRQLAAAAGLRAGDIVMLSADPAGRGARQFRVADVYEPMPDPMLVTSRRLEARLHLPDLLGLTANPADPLTYESVGALNIALRDPGDVQAFARDLGARLPGLIVRPTLRPADTSNPFAVLERFHLAIAIVTVVASTIFLLALMVMLAEERREAVGILRLLGLSKRRVLVQVFAEGLIIAVAGAAFGVGLAAASENAINRFFQWRYDTSLVFVSVTAGIAWRSVALAVPFGIAASIVASWALLRRDTIALMRR